MDEITHKCLKCGEIKSISKFHYTNTCKDCYKQWMADYYNANKNKLLEYSKDYNKEHRDRIRKREKKYRQTEKGRNVIRKSKRNYAIKYPEKIKANHRIKSKRKVQKLSDIYIITTIKAITGLSSETIRKNPDLIENYRKQIELKRLLKKVKYENFQAS
jgi:hypothetical protein